MFAVDRADVTAADGGCPHPYDDLSVPGCWVRHVADVHLTVAGKEHPAHHATSSRRAPPDGCTEKISGRAKPAPANARATASVTAALSPARTNAIADPPNPPPVMRAPRAPASTAADTAVSSSRIDTSKSSRSERCDASRRGPSAVTSPPVKMATASSTRAFSLTT